MKQMHLSLHIPSDSDNPDGHSPRNAGSESGDIMYGTASLCYLFLGGIAALGQVSRPLLLKTAFVCLELACG